LHLASQGRVKGACDCQTPFWMSRVDAKLNVGINFVTTQHIGRDRRETGCKFMGMPIQYSL
jgi:hypothetical protein